MAKKAKICKYTMGKSKNGRAHKWQSRKGATAAARAHAAASGGTGFIFMRCYNRPKAMAPKRIGHCTAKICTWY